MGIPPAAAALLLIFGVASLSAQQSAPPGGRQPARRQAQPAPRTRISLDNNWRFHRGDPPGNTVNLAYDVRPEVREGGEDKPADAQPGALNLAASPGQAVVKPWILP